jgi:hypothetical protein
LAKEVNIASAFPLPNGLPSLKADNALRKQIARRFGLAQGPPALTFAEN